jgi:type VI secretion system secreted protein Hcp
MRRPRLLVRGAILSVFAAFGVVAPAEGADYFLEINGIPGESQDAKQAKSVDVLSYSWGVSRPPATSSTGGAGGKPTLKELTIHKRVDVASPLLFRRLAAGQTISSMELIGRKSGASPLIFLRYCFQNVQVTSIQQSDATGAGPAPEEDVTFFYVAVSEQYTRQNPDGSIGQTVFAGWNSNTGVLISTYPTTCGF